ncbi:MAG: hypothetical protein JWN19_2874 [Arthrobacter sp.]|nr:hypothetical protein [Arthrobacter sp.]
MPAPELNDGEVDVHIRTPLPGSVVLTLGNLMDAVWPGAQLVDGEKGEITFRINKTAQTPVTKRRRRPCGWSPRKRI